MDGEWSDAREARNLLVTGSLFLALLYAIVSALKS
jgi:hypothetical protein